MAAETLAAVFAETPFVLIGNVTEVCPCGTMAYVLPSGKKLTVELFGNVTAGDALDIFTNTPGNVPPK